MQRRSAQVGVGVTRGGLLVVDALVVAVRVTVAHRASEGALQRLPASALRPHSLVTVRVTVFWPPSRSQPAATPACARSLSLSTDARTFACVLSLSSHETRPWLPVPALCGASPDCLHTAQLRCVAFMRLARLPKRKPLASNGMTMQSVLALTIA